MADTEGKRLTELRVIDLKTELERRGLDKTGNKAALLERLSKVISEEGHNPEEFLIVPYVGPKVTPRKNSVTGLSNLDDSMDTSDVQKDENSEGQEAGEENAASEPAEEVVEPEVEEVSKDEKKDKKETEEENEEKEDPDEAKEEEESSKETEVKDEEPKEKEIEKSKVQEVEKEKKEVPAVKETPQTVEVSASAIETNGIDNEDSINLTIGEDEENLLAEEEAHDRQKDGGDKKRAQDNKKGDSKGSGRAESSASNKDGTSGASIGTKSKDAGEGGKSGDSNSKGQKRDDKDKKSSQNSSNASSRNLWVSGLSSTTRATDLKQIFSKYGKVIGAKVVTNARTPGARCYGYVTMSTSDDASKCISHLHRTELHGRFISVEKAKGDSQQSHMRKRDSNGGKSEKPKDEKEKPKDNHHESSVEKKESVEKKKESEEKEKDTSAKDPEEKEEAVEEKKSDKEVEKKEDKEKDADARSTKSTSKKPESERGKRDEKRVRSFDRHRTHSRSRSRERRRRDDVLTFAKIREERDRQRLRERERLVREEERRRREDMERQREVERRQREEASRLEREREKLRRERERIEQEKAELLRLERERQKLEREKLERERLELKRQQMRLEESRRVPPPPSIKRTSSDRRDPRDLYVEPDRKRLTTEHARRHSPERVPDRRTDILERVSDRRMDPSPPTRYDASRSAQDLGLKKDFKRGSEFSSRGSRPEAFTDVSRGREVIVRREPLPAPPTIDPRQVKERYERPSATSYGRDRDVRRSEADSHRSSRDTHGGRYDSSKPPGSNAPRDSRYVDNNRGPGGWHSGPPAKSFNSVPSGGARDPRNETSGWSGRSSDNVNRWGNSNSMGNTLRHPGPPMYQGGPMPSMGMSGPGAPASYDRFDPYKGSMPMRKY